MQQLMIRGGKKLSGSLTVSSAKNAYLPILAGCILGEEEIILHNYPSFTDVDTMVKILEGLGATTKKSEKTLIINPESIGKSEIPKELASIIRSSIFSLGSIIGRFKKAKCAYPGGCDIGSRPIDLHLKGLRALGVKITDKHGFITCDGNNLKGGLVHLDFPSVGATENIMLAAVKAKGRTEIINAAKEPEVADLANFLNAMGAKILGAGTENIVVEGVKSLHKVEYTPIPDRIIAGTYLLACLMAGGDIELKNVKTNHIQSLLLKLRNSSCKIRIVGDTIRLSGDKRLKAISSISTSPYPGFPTDLQPQILTLQTVSKGTCMIVENMFETRFKHVPELRKMGANIEVNGRVAVVRGVEHLFGAEVNATDLRSGISMVMAGITAQGYTKINNIHHIDRGYESVEHEFALLGADIRRIFTVE